MRPSLNFALLALSALSVHSACQSNAPPEAPKAPPGSPGKAAGPAMAPEQPARVVPSGQSHATEATSQPMPANPHAGMGMDGLPPGHPPVGAGMGPPGGGSPISGAAPPINAGPGGRLKGHIALDAARAADVKAGAVLFIIVRRDAGEGQKGPLLASQKVEVTGPAMFPLAYEIGPEHVMMAGTALDGQVRVEARVDQDGDAISKQPGDVTGARTGAVAVGTDAVDFSLNVKM